MEERYDPMMKVRSNGMEVRSNGMQVTIRLHFCPECPSIEFGYFLCYFKMVAPRALVFRPLVKGNEDSGNEIGRLGDQPGSFKLWPGSLKRFETL